MTASRFDRAVARMGRVGIQTFGEDIVLVSSGVAYTLRGVFNEPVKPDPYGPLVVEQSQPIVKFLAADVPGTLSALDVLMIRGAEYTPSSAPEYTPDGLVTIRL